MALLVSISNRWSRLAALDGYGDSGGGRAGTACVNMSQKILESGNVLCRWKVSQFRSISMLMSEGGSGGGMAVL